MSNSSSYRFTNILTPNTMYTTGCRTEQRTLKGRIYCLRLINDIVGGFTDIWPVWAVTSVRLHLSWRRDVKQLPNMQNSNQEFSKLIYSGTKVQRVCKIMTICPCFIFTSERVEQNQSTEPDVELKQSAQFLLSCWFYL